MSFFVAALIWLALLGAALLLVWALYRQPPSVELSRELPTGGFEGHTLPLTVRVKLRSRLPTRVVIQDEPPRRVVADIVPVIQATLFGELHTQTDTTLTLNRRGVYQWQGATLSWADPLGLFWRSVTLDTPQRLEVYPATHGLILPDLLRPLLSEGALSRSLGLEDPLSLRGAREYSVGDPPSRMHWRLSARGAGLMVRELERTASSSLSIYLDLQHASEVYLESAVRLAASLVQEAQQLGLAVSVATDTGASPSGRNYESQRLALVALAEAAPTTAAPHIPAPPLGSNLIVLTQRADDKLVGQAITARGRASRVSIVALPEGFYLEPGEKPRKQWASPPETVRALAARAGTLAEFGVLVYLLRGNQSVLKLGV